MNTNIKELATINNACDELLNGKYILIDIKIKSILNVINSDSKIKDIVSSCVSRHNFIELYNLAMSHVSFNENCQIVAFVYNLLYKFSTKDLDFNEFINTLYPEQEIEEQIKNFVENIIIPFKNAVDEIYIKRHIIVDSSEYQNNYYNKIKNVVNIILSNLDNYKLDINSKDEYSMLLNALYNASDKNDKNLVYTLMIAIDYFTKCNKKARKTYLALEECFS